MSIDSTRPETRSESLESIDSLPSSDQNPVSHSANERMASAEQAQPPPEVGRAAGPADHGEEKVSTATERMIRIEHPRQAEPIQEAPRTEDDNGTPTDSPAGNQALEPVEPAGPDDADIPNSRDGEGTTAPDDPAPSRDGSEDSAREAIGSDCRCWGVDTREGIDAVHRAYDVVKDKIAPIVTRYAVDIVDRCKTEVAADPDHRCAFLGRDGYPIAAAVAELDPDFYANHASSVAVTRLKIERALQDAELNLGKSFDIDPFRKYKGHVFPEGVDGALAELTDELEEHGLPVTETGRTITVIDSSFKGSTQEGLAALFPGIEWKGLYLVHEQHPKDPHPGSKKGLAHHIEAADADNTTNSNKKTVVDVLPEDRTKTFAHPTAVLAIEDLLHGPFPSPNPEIDSTRPEAAPVDEINPLDISPAFQNSATRIAASSAMLLAARDHAHTIARLRAAGGDHHLRELYENAERSIDELRAWISGDNPDPHLNEVLDAFVRPIDRHVIAELRSAIGEGDLGPADENRIWTGYQQAGSLEDKRAYADDHIHTMTHRP